MWAKPSEPSPEGFCGCLCSRRVLRRNSAQLGWCNGCLSPPGWVAMDPLALGDWFAPHQMGTVWAPDPALKKDQWVEQSVWIYFAYMLSWEWDFCAGNRLKISCQRKPKFLALSSAPASLQGNVMATEELPTCVDKCPKLPWNWSSRIPPDPLGRAGTLVLHEQSWRLSALKFKESRANRSQQWWRRDQGSPQFQLDAVLRSNPSKALPCCQGKDISFLYLKDKHQIFKSDLLES